MSAPEWFRIANLFVIPGWLLLLAAPRWRWTQPLTSRVIPATLACAYAIVLTTHWDGSGSFSTLAGVRTLFANDWLLLGGWIHYLAFDLLIGSWISRECFAQRIALFFVAPCLVLTFLFGPVGWLLYLAVRTIHMRWNQGSH